MAGTRRASARGRTRGARGGTAGSVQVKRAYEEPAAGDGYRVLVDRLWPRGVRKEALAIDAWMKEIAPSDELRRWFGHDPTRWEEFAARYREAAPRSAGRGARGRDFGARATRAGDARVRGQGRGAQPGRRPARRDRQEGARRAVAIPRAIGERPRTLREERPSAEGQSGERLIAWIVPAR